MKRFVSVELRGEIHPGTITLSSSIEHHFARVLRCQVGDSISLCDGHGTVASGRIVQLKPLQMEVETVETSPPGKPLTVCLSILKADRWSWALEKLTEVGVTAIVPISAERSVIKGAEKRDRWDRICEGATRQSGRLYVPEIFETRSVQSFLAEDFDHVLADFDANEATPNVENPALWVGPEGGFTQDELELLRKTATRWTFSQAVLRAETAAILGAGMLAR